MRIAAEPDMSVIGETADKKNVFELASRLHPDVLLIDLDSLRPDGKLTVKALHRICPQFSIILLSMDDDAPSREQARRDGAAAFVAKSSPTENLLAAIRQVAITSVPAVGK